MIVNAQGNKNDSKTNIYLVQRTKRLGTLRIKVF